MPTSPPSPIPRSSRSILDLSEPPGTSDCWVTIRASSSAICKSRSSDFFRKFAYQGVRFRRKPVLPRQHVKLHVRCMRPQTIGKSARQSLGKKLVFRSRDMQNWSPNSPVLVLFPVLWNPPAHRDHAAGLIRMGANNPVFSPTGCENPHQYKVPRRNPEPCAQLARN